MVRVIASALGLVALIAAIVVGALAATGVLSDAAGSSRVGGSQANVEEEARRAETKVIDESVTAGNLSWTVDEARRMGELSSYTYPPTTLRGDFLVLTFTVENTSDGPVTLTDDSMVLVGNEGLTSHPAPAINNEYVLPEEAILFNERGLLDPGEKMKGKVNFDLEIPFGPSANLSDFRLQLGDGDPTIEEGKSVDLGL